MKKRDKLFSQYEDEIHEIAEKHKNDNFLYLSQNDIKQKIYSICYEALNKFDQEKSSIKTFLTRCVTNRLKNFKRDNYFRYENPCKKERCFMFNPFTKECTSKTYKNICTTYQKTSEKMQKQAHLANPTKIEDVKHSVFSIQDNSKHIDYNLQKMEIRDILIRASGEYIGIKYDLLIRYGPDMLDSNELKFIQSIAEEYING